ncbi:MAG: (2Fe-2S)-binding protein [Bryobacteraceae bacterium]
MSKRSVPEVSSQPSSKVSRRGFMGGVGLGGGVLGADLLESEAQAQPAGQAGLKGPGAVPVTLQVNGKPYNLTVEPRVTLLDALRDHLGLTGAKRICDRGTCGACTVMLDGKAVYACSVLAIDVQGRQIQTIESLSVPGQVHPLIQSFVNNDAQQCGFCTPGFVMAAKHFLEKHPNPTYEQVKNGLGGNICRCGTYMGIRRAVVEAGARMKGGAHA